jgi:hypothetical protein
MRYTYKMLIKGLEAILTCISETCSVIPCYYTAMLFSSFIFFWNDEIRRWDPEDYGGIYITKLPILKTWMPMVFLRNGVHGYSFYTYNNDMEIATSKTTYYSNGDALFVTFGFYGVTCESDVTYYPFDEHKCTIMILLNIY